MSIITTKNGLEKIYLDEGWDRVRFRLLRSSYILSEVVKSIREKYGITVDSKGKTNWRKIAYTKYWDQVEPFLKKWGYFSTQIKDNGEELGWRAHFALGDAEKEILTEIPLLADQLSMDEGYLRVFVLYNNRTNKVDGPASIEHMQVGDKVRQRGTYLRLEDIHSISELKAEYSKYRDYYLNGIFKEDSAKLPKYKQDRKKVISPEDAWKINVYMLLQEKLSYVGDISNRNELLRKYDGQLPRLLEMAINEAVDDITSKMDVAEEMEEYAVNISKSKIRNAYKDVVERYQLPNLVDIKRLVRLIGC